MSTGGADKAAAASRTVAPRGAEIYIVLNPIKRSLFIVVLNNIRA
jgi:hypothetical protein